MAALLAA